MHQSYKVSNEKIKIGQSYKNTPFWDTESDFIEPEQMTLLRSLIEILVQEFPIKYLVGHSDVTGESKDNCPGTELYNQLTELRKSYELKGY